MLQQEPSIKDQRSHLMRSICDLPRDARRILRPGWPHMFGLSVLRFHLYDIREQFQKWRANAA